MVKNILPDNPDDTKMSLGDHLEELRVRIIRALLGLVAAFAITCWFGTEILGVLQAPVVEVMAEYNIDKASLVSRTVSMPFMLYVRAAMTGAFIIASPWIFYQMWLFIAAGLYPHERKYVNWAVPFSALLFCAGAAFFLLFIAKQIMRFFLGFGVQFMPEVAPMLDIKDYFALVTTLMIVFGLAFQTPIVVFILGKMGLVTVAQLRKVRRYVIVVILIIAALATSPSPVDQIGLAVPMWLLYEIGILLVYFFCKPKEEEDYDGGDYDDYDPYGSSHTALAGATYNTGYDHGTPGLDYDYEHGEHYENYYSDEYYDDEYYPDEPQGGAESDNSDYGEYGDDNYYDDYDYDSSGDQGFTEDDWSYDESSDGDDDEAKPDVDFESESGYSWRPS